MKLGILNKLMSLAADLSPLISELDSRFYKLIFLILNWPWARLFQITSFCSAVSQH